MTLSERADALVFGRDPVVAVRLAGVAGTCFFLALGLHLLVHFLLPLSATADPVVTLVFAAAFVAAAAGGYLNDGLLVCVALAAGVSVGFYLPLLVFHLDALGETTLWALAVGVGAALGLGVAGFLAGAGLRRVAG